ncbi:hypothetical protein [Acinetobacter sp.]|uniref:hypothetical protein n=1 Tax=Acinetobacter sp. TaxID=472 RepID=UPI002FCB85DB
MGTDSTNEQLNQCLTALSNANVHWWDALAITQSQADDLSLAIVKIMAAAIAYALIAYLLKTA